MFKTIVSIFLVLFMLQSIYSQRVVLDSLQAIEVMKDLERLRITTNQLQLCNQQLAIIDDQRAIAEDLKSRQDKLMAKVYKQQAENKKIRKQRKYWQIGAIVLGGLYIYTELND